MIGKMKISLIGQKFNRLTVIKLLGKKSGHNNYLCQCNCGNFTEALPTNFKSGKVKSCGCLRKEGSNLKHGLKNTIYILSGQKLKVDDILKPLRIIKIMVTGV